MQFSPSLLPLSPPSPSSPLSPSPLSPPASLWEITKLHLFVILDKKLSLNSVIKSEFHFLYNFLPSTLFLLSHSFSFLLLYPSPLSLIPASSYWSLFCWRCTVVWSKIRMLVLVTQTDNAMGKTSLWVFLAEEDGKDSPYCSPQVSHTSLTGSKGQRKV
jgi:hypothetical protein